MNLPILEYEVPITINSTLAQKDMEYLLCAAFEGGINYWCSEIIVEDFHGFTHASEVLAAGYPVTLIDMEDEDQNRTIDGESLKKAMALMAEQYPLRMRDICSDGDYDANDADIFVQLACFGEVVYG